MKKTDNSISKIRTTVLAFVLGLLVIGILVLGMIKDREAFFQNGESSALQSSAENNDPVSSDTFEITTDTTAEEDVSSANESVGALPKFAIKKIEEQGEKIVVVTEYCTMSYPNIFPALLDVAADYADDAAYLTFSAVISGNKMPVYTLMFNTADGISVGTLMIEGCDKPLRVSVNFHEPLPDVKGDDLILYHAYSESFGDIAESLTKNYGFAEE